MTCSGRSRVWCNCKKGVLAIALPELCSLPTQERVKWGAHKGMKDPQIKTCTAGLHSDGH